MAFPINSATFCGWISHSGPTEISVRKALPCELIHGDTEALEQRHQLLPGCLDFRNHRMFTIFLLHTMLLPSSYCIASGVPTSSLLLDTLVQVQC